MASDYRVEILDVQGRPVVDRLLGLEDAVDLVCDHRELHARSVRATLDELPRGASAFEIPVLGARGGGLIRVSRCHEPPLLA